MIRAVPNPWTLGFGNKLAVVALSLLPVACSDAPPDGSAGLGETASMEPRWQVSAEPLLVIGNRTPEEEFQAVRGAVRRTDGTIAVADANRILLFSADGTYLRTIGRQGQGPGEFGGILWLRSTSSDSLVAFDARLNRLSVFAPDGEFVRSVIASGIDAPEPFVARLADGNLVTHRSGEGGSEASPAVTRIADGTLVLRDPTGVAIRDLGPVPGEELLFASNGIPHTGLPYLKALSLAAGSTRVFASAGDALEVLVFDVEGNTSTTFRADREPIPFDPGLLEGRAAEPVQGIPRADLPSSYRAVTGLLVDKSENLWVREAIVDPLVPPTWVVFGPSGDLLSRVQFPPRFQPLEIGPDYALGVWRDDLDVQYVRLYAPE